MTHPANLQILMVINSDLEWLWLKNLWQILRENLTSANQNDVLMTIKITILIVPPELSILSLKKNLRNLRQCDHIVLVNVFKIYSVISLSKHTE